MAEREIKREQLTKLLTIAGYFTALLSQASKTSSEVKDGAIHLHGLISGDMDFVPNDRGVTTESGQIIYNMPQWKFGFSTAIELYGDFINCAKYITKYISKDFRKIFGSFYYAGGCGLVRHPDVELLDIDYFSLDCKEYSKPFFGFKYLTISKECEVL